MGMTMDELQSSSKQPHIRFLVSCPLSGLTRLMKIFARSPVCAVTSGLILRDNVDSTTTFASDYSILNEPSNHSISIDAVNSGKRFIISKEQMGNNRLNGKGPYNIFPTPSVYDMVRPIFLVRDAIQVFDSWKSVGWTDTQNLVDCYTNMFQVLHQAPSHAMTYLIYERLIQDPRTEVKRICKWWGVPYSETMLDFNPSLDSSLLFSTDRNRAIYDEEKSHSVFMAKEAGPSVERNVPYHGLLSNAEKHYIERRVGRLYLGCWQDDILRLRAVLAEKSWIGFDLDDTLHEFRRSSGMAITEVLERIADKYGTPVLSLREEYPKVLKEKTANAFSDGKTSSDYRRERFLSLLSRFSLPQEVGFIAELLELYEATLMTSLELKCGALELLSTLKGMGKKIVVVTEGPQDAQERTVRGLGIDGHIDFLATTNHFRATKTSDLFTRVLEHLRVSASDMAYIGDNKQRDMEPAMKEGIFAVHLAEAKHVSLNAFPPHINTLWKLRYILSDDNP